MLFVCIVALTVYLFPRKIRYVWLLVCSYAFYLYDPVDITRNLPALAMLAGATLLSYGCAFGIALCKQKALRRVFLAVSVAACLGLLVYYKITTFPDMALVADAAQETGTALPWLLLGMPLGLAFYTLQTVRYAVDVYRGTVPLEKNPALYALYVSFFPAIVTGPINRAADMLPQYRSPPAFSYNRVAGGLFRVLWGFFKCTVIAAGLAPFTSRVLSVPLRYSGPEIALAVLLFTYQFYAEFSGLLDIATGSARMLGLSMAEDFQNPFGAKTYWGLWRRWQSSLTGFLRDTVYIPLGGKKLAMPVKLATMLLCFLLGAAWYGVGYKFLFWGVACAAVSIIGKALFTRKEQLVARIPVYRNRFVRGFFSRFGVCLLFCATTFLYADALLNASVVGSLKALFAGWNLLFSGMLPLALTAAGFGEMQWIVLGASIFLVVLVEGFAIRPGSTVADWIRRRLFFVRWPLYLVLLCALFLFGVFSAQPSVIISFTFEHFGAFAAELLEKFYALFGLTLPI